MSALPTWLRGALFVTAVMKDRFFITLCAAGKLSFFALVVWLCAEGRLPLRAPVAASADLLRRPLRRLAGRQSDVALRLGTGCAAGAVRTPNGARRQTRYASDSRKVFGCTPFACPMNGGWML
jgi:hypothetical protein